MFTLLRSKLILLKNHQGFRRYAANTSWMMAEQMVRMIAGLFVGIWVARYLGPEQFGLFSYVLAFTAIFGGIAKLGLDGILVRELVNHPELRDTYLGTAFWLKVIGAFLVIALMALIVPFTSNDSTTNLYIFIIAAGLVFQSFEVVEFYFQAQVLAKIVSICKVIQLMLSSMIKVYLVLTEAELLMFVFMAVFDSFGIAVSYFIVYKRKADSNFFKCFNVTFARKMLSDSWPLILSTLVVIIYMRIDQIMIKEILGTYEVGIYAAAVKLSESMYILATVISISLFPAIIKSMNNTALYQARVQKLYTLLVIIALSCAVFFTFSSKSIILLLFGPDYIKAAPVLMIHAWSAIFVYLAVSSGKVLTSEGKTKKIFYRNCAGMILNIALNYFFIPLFGINGAAISTLISWFFAGYIYDFCDSEQNGMAKQKTKAFFGSVK